jgi:hypothetical protein
MAEKKDRQLSKMFWTCYTELMMHRCYACNTSYTCLTYKSYGK